MHIKLRGPLEKLLDKYITVVKDSLPQRLVVQME